MGFAPKHSQSVLKRCIICSLGIVDSRNEEVNIDQSQIGKKRRASYLNDRINQYNDLAWTTKDVRRWLIRSAVNHWEMGDEDMAE